MLFKLVFIARLVQPNPRNPLVAYAPNILRRNTSLHHQTASNMFFHHLSLLRLHSNITAQALRRSGYHRPPCVCAKVGYDVGARLTEGTTLNVTKV